jgi:NAD(P) transhydrogenase
MAQTHFDVVVIGSGPGGEGAAMQAVKQGKSVAVAERYRQIGGACTHLGTIPSKALRYAIFQMTEANANPLFRAAGVSVRLPFPEIRRFAHRVVEQQVNTRQAFYDRNHIPVLCGNARFIDPKTIEVDEPNGVKHRLTAGGFVIATGSRPYRPPDVDFTHPRIFDSDTILDLPFTPQSITIYGAGVVGCEYTSMFRNLESKVNLVNTRSRLLEFLDDEITDALSYHMRDRGVLIRHMDCASASRGATTASCCTSKAASSSRPTCCCGQTAARETRTGSVSTESASFPTSEVRLRSTSSCRRPTRISMPSVT